MLPRIEFGNVESLAASLGSKVLSLDGHLVVSSFPAPGILPEEREDDLALCGESFCWQIDVVKIPSTLFGLAVVTGLPVVETPMHQRRFHQQKAQLLSAGQRARLVVETPVEVCRRYFLFYVTLYRLRGLIENLAVDERPAQLDVFGVRPNQRARRPRPFSREQFALRDVGCVPYLFGNQAARSG